MKQIQGTSYNIGDDIVGRITFGKKKIIWSFQRYTGL